VRHVSEPTAPVAREMSGPEAINVQNWRDSLRDSATSGPRHVQVPCSRLDQGFGGTRTANHDGVTVRNTFLDFPVELSDDDLLGCDFVRHVSEPTAPVAREMSGPEAINVQNWRDSLRDSDTSGPRHVKVPYSLPDAAFGTIRTANRGGVTVRNTFLDFPGELSDDDLSACDFVRHASEPTATVARKMSGPEDSLRVSDTSGPRHVQVPYSRPDQAFGNTRTANREGDSHKPMGVNIGDTHVASLGDPVLIKPQNTLVNSASEVRPSFCPSCGEPTASGHKFCPYCRFELHSLPSWQTVGAMPWAVPVHTPNLLTALNKLRCSVVCLLLMCLRSCAIQYSLSVN